MDSRQRRILRREKRRSDFVQPAITQSDTVLPKKSEPEKQARKLLGFETFLALILVALTWGWDLSGFPHSIVGACALWAVAFILASHIFWQIVHIHNFYKSSIAIVALVAVVAFLWNPVKTRYRIERERRPAPTSLSTSPSTGFEAQYTRGLRVENVTSVGSEIGISIKNSDDPHLKNVQTFATEKELQDWYDYLLKQQVLNSKTMEASITEKQIEIGKNGRVIPPKIVQRLKALEGNPRKLKAFLEKQNTR